MTAHLLPTLEQFSSQLVAAATDSDLMKSASDNLGTAMKYVVDVTIRAVAGIQGMRSEIAGLSEALGHLGNLEFGAAIDAWNKGQQEFIRIQEGMEKRLHDLWSGKGDRLDIAGPFKEGTAAVNEFGAAINGLPRVTYGVGGGVGGSVQSSGEIGKLLTSLRTDIAAIRENDPVERRMIELQETLRGASATEVAAVRRLITEQERLNGAADAINSSVNGSGDRIVGALGQQTSALVAGLSRMEAQAAAANAANTSGKFGGSIGGSQTMKFSVNVAAQKQLDALAREQAALQAGPMTEGAQQRLAQIQTESAQLTAHMGEVAAAFQDLKPSLLSMVASGMEFDMVVQSINNELKRRFGASGADFFSSTAIPKFAGGFANGGTIPRGQFGIVGEKGPELIKGPTNVIPMQAAPQQAAVTHNNDNSRGDINISPGAIVVNGATDADSFRLSEREIGRRIAAEVQYYMQGR